MQKDGSEFGRLQAMQTLAHNEVYTYINDASIKPGIHGIEGAVAFWNESHPMVFLEAGGHGALGATDRRSLFHPATMQFAGTGVTYVPKGVAERPAAPSAREVGYELLPIDEHWWRKATSAEWKEPTFDEPFEYAPFGGRPRPRNAKLFGAFLGRKQAANKARPFWGWFDTKTRSARILNTGQWALDPAYSLSRCITLPSEQRFSLDYTHNPYLDIVTESQRALMEAPPEFVAATALPPGGIPVPIPPATAERGLRGALSQVLTGSNRETLGGLLRQAGVGAGGQDALRSIGGVETCTLSVTTTGPAELVIRGKSVEAPEGVEVKANCALPQSTIRLRMDLRSGPGEVNTLELPAMTNQWATRLRFDKAGQYEVVLSW